MILFEKKDEEFRKFTDSVETMVMDIEGLAKEEDVNSIRKFIANFKLKTKDFYREDRQLNIGVIGQVKAGKSSFLNTLLFGGQEILPKASTPKTATLTKMEYADENRMYVEYYLPEEWEVLEENAAVDLDDEIYSSARELVEMVRQNGTDPWPYLERGSDSISFASYEELIKSLNDYVGEDGKLTPIVKAVTLYLNREEFQGLSIVDTPGLNDPIASRTIQTKKFMEVCDVVFFLSQSGSFLDKSDWILLSSQLPQKGVKRLALIASKYDSGVRDVLRVQEDDDIFGEDENTADNIPKACRIVKKKLQKRAKSKVAEFVKDLERRESSPELIKVIRQCEKPLFVSAMTYNMAGKPVSEFSREEQNIYSALKPFSENMESDLRLLGNFEEVITLFEEVVKEKEDIFEQKANGFLPNAREELRNRILLFIEKTEKRIRILEKNDREKLLEQKRQIESQMGNIKADIAAVFGDLNARLEAEKAKAIRELREAGKDYLGVKERTGSVTRTRSYTTGFLFWKKTHYYTYEEHYSYCLAADAIENIRSFALEASNQVEEVFTASVKAKEIKRKLLKVVVNNFDMGNEKYDSSLFRIIVEETVSAIEFPVLDIDISDMANSIAGKFNGELTSAGRKTELSAALSEAVSGIYSGLCIRLEAAVRDFRKEMSEISIKIQNQLLANISGEFEMLLEQCENKDREIAACRDYAAVLEKWLEGGFYGRI